MPKKNRKIIYRNYEIININKCFILNSIDHDHAEVTVLITHTIYKN